MDKIRRQTDEDFGTTVDPNQKETHKEARDEDLKKTVESRQDETQQHAKDEEFRKAAEANKKTHKKGKGNVIYDTYENRQGKAILRESRKRLKELSEKQEDRKSDMKYLRERQLEKYRQWDSLSKENQPIVIDGADINYRFKSGESLLHAACLHRRFHTVQLLHNKCPLLVHQFDSKGRSVCHSAAAGGSVDVLNFLVQEDADPLCKDVDGMNLLHYACLEGNKEMAFHLMDNYSDMLYNVGKWGYTVPHCAAYGGSIDIFKRVSKLFTLSSRVDSANHSEQESHREKQPDLKLLTETGETLLHMACLGGRLEMTKYLVETYPDMINGVNKYKAFLTHYAAAGGNISVLQYLIDQGLDPGCRTETQQTLLHMSCISGRLEITEYLVEKYPDIINMVDIYNRTPAHYAAYGGNISVIQPMTAQDLNQWSGRATQQILSHMPFTKSHLEIMKYLGKKYPDIISAVDSCNETTAHYAAESGNIFVLQYLIGKGLDPWCRTEKQETLLHKSCVGSVLETIKYLVETYPNMIHAVDSCNRTAAHYVTRSSNVFILQYLIDQGLDPWCRTDAQETLLHMSCIAGQLEMTHYLVEKYPEMVTEVDNCKRTVGHFAAQNNNISVLQYLFDQGLDPWCRTATQETLLHMSCIAGRLEMTKYLVEKYPEMIHEVDKRNETPGHYASQSINVSVLQYLIDQGLDPWSRTFTEETLLHVSSISGSLMMSKYLVEKYPDMINMVDKYEETPGHYAAYGGNVNILQYLIAQGLDPWGKSIHQQTLLHQSCIAGQLEMSKYLVEKYPDMINEVDSSKETSAHCAAYGGNIFFLQYLIDQGQDPLSTSVQQQTLLHHSCKAGQLEMSKYLVEKYPAMINAVEYCKETPAHYAAQSSNILVLKYLIDQGAEPWSRTATQETLLHKACIAGQLEITQYLIEKYPNMVSEFDNCKRTPAHYAAQSSNISVIQYLINHGLDPWCRTATQETLLHRSCLAGQLEMTQYLVEKYPDMLKVVDIDQGTAGHFAAQSDNISLLQYLVDQGLDPWCRTFKQDTLLHKACIVGQLEMAQFLIQKYPDMINKVNNSNNTPGHYAAIGGNVSVLQYLIDQGLDPWCRTVTEDTLLDMSCIAGELEMTQYLVEKYPNMISEVDKHKRTPGHNAAVGGNISLLEYLINHGLDPRCKTATQFTLLHMSCFAGQLEMSIYLVETYPDMINQVDNCNRTPGHYAAQSGNVSLLEYLIRQGLDPWCRTTKQETLLHMSSNAGKLEMSRYLVEKYPDMINKFDSSKGTPSHYAAQSSKVSVLQYLTDQGLDPWCRTATQQTLLHMSCIAGQLEMTNYLVTKYPLMMHFIMFDNCLASPAHYAAQNGNVSVLQYLIDKGVDPWCRTVTQETLLHRSCNAGKLEMSRYLVEKYPDMMNMTDLRKGTPAHYAAQSGNVSVLQYVIDQGLDPWCRTATQETLLHMSSIAGQLEMTQYLVEKYPGMINIDSVTGQSPGHYASLSGNVSVLQYLISQGMDPWCKTDTQETLLHTSCISGQLEMIQYLLFKYPDMINEVNNCKVTPGHYAAQRGNVSVLHYLLDKGLDPWCRTDTQETLLHRACSAGQLEMSKYLVEIYPNMINLVDNCKSTSGHCAAHSGNVSLLQHLIDKGLDPWCRTDTQQTLLHIALIAARMKMVKYLVHKYPAMISSVQFNMHL